MATVKVKFRPSSVNGREGMVYYQVIHNRVARQVATDYKVHTSEWDGKNHRIAKSQSPDRTNFLLSLQEKIRCDTERFRRILATFIWKGVCFSTEDVVTEFKSLTSRLSLFNFMGETNARLRQEAGYAQARLIDMHSPVFCASGTMRMYRLML